MKCHVAINPTTKHATQRNATHVVVNHQFSVTRGHLEVAPGQRNRGNRWNAFDSDSTCPAVQTREPLHGQIVLHSPAEFS
jgi:hypothetical protein